MTAASPSRARMAYDQALFYKGLILESNSRIDHAIRSTGDKALAAAYDEMRTLRKRLEYFTISDSASSLEFSYIHDRSLSLEDSIYSACPALSQIRIKRNSTWKNVRDRLKSGEAAIEFIQNDAMYGALILRKGYDAPHYVALLSDSALKSYMGSGRMSPDEVRKLYRPATRLKRNFNGQKLYEELWKPLEAELAGVERVYYTPSGRLSAIQFAAIEDTAGTPICRKYDLRLLSTTAQILNTASSSGNSRRTVSMIGDVNYDASPSAPEGRGWHHLDNSVKEIQAVDSLCSVSPILMTAHRQTGTEASEQWLRSISGNSPDIMLLSTHGFYLNADDARGYKYYRNKGIVNDNNENSVIIPPLQRGGLVLADANPVWTDSEKRPDDNDGILTAAELSDLDFNGTSLAVLSACQTGMGEYSATEGVNGLQRGLKMSGIESLIMSLWEVNDRSGYQFMETFFKLMSSGAERHDAFRSAQLQLQEQYPQDPYLWAPFIMLD